MGRDNLLDSSAADEHIVCELYRLGMIRTWYRDKPEGWTLVSGLWSPLYIQLRGLCSYPTLLGRVGRAIGDVICREVKGVTRLVGVAMAGIPIAVSASLASGLPCAMTRKLEGVRKLEDLDQLSSSYGEHGVIEGELKDGDVLVLVDDLVTRFDSKLVALRQVEWEVQKRSLRDVRCADVAVLFDREQGAREAAEKNCMRLHALVRFKSEGMPELKRLMHPREYEVVDTYLSAPDKFQGTEIRAALAREAYSTSQQSHVESPAAS